MPRYQINVARGVLRRNHRTGANDPALIVRDYGTENPDPYTMARGVVCHGQTRIVQNVESAWVETDGPIDLIDPQPGLNDPQGDSDGVHPNRN